MKTRDLWWVWVVAVALASAGAGDLTTFKYDQQRTGFTSEKVAPPVSLLWKFSTSEDREISAAPIVVGNRVFFCAQGAVYCLDAETGQTVWPPYPTKFNIRMTPVYHNGHLYVGNDNGELHILDAADEPTGDRVVDILDFRAPLRSDPIIVGNVMFVINDSGTLYQLNLETRELKELDDWFGSGPRRQTVYQDDRLYVTGRDNIVYGYDLKRKRRMWAKSEGNLVTPPTFANDLLLIATRTGPKGLRTTSGNPRWQPNAFIGAKGSPSVSGNLAYVFGRDEFLYVVEATKGKLLGRVEMDSPVEGTATIADKILYVGTGAGNICAVDTQTLEKIWTYRCSPTDTVGPDLPQFAVNVPIAVANGAVYAINQQGTLFCLRADAIDVGKPRLYQPQLVTTAVDGKEVAFPLLDDELREAMIDEAKRQAPAGEEPEIPADAEELQLPGKQPVFRFETYCYDEGSGVDLAQMRVEFDAQPYLGKLMFVTPNDHLLTVHLVSPDPAIRRQRIPDGQHVLKLSVPDYRGNTVVRTFTFTIDNTLPPIEPPKDEKDQPGGQPGLEGGMPPDMGMPGAPMP